MNMCPHGCGFSSPIWDHLPDCPYWPGTEWARRHGWRKDCGGLVDCDEIHPYEPHDACDCLGACHYCCHIGCVRCIDKAYADRSWWRKLLNLEPGRWRQVHRTSLLRS